MAQFIELNAQNPQPHRLGKISECLKSGGLIAYPTDSVYALGCDINNLKAIEKLCLIKGVKPEKAQFSIIFRDISEIANYAKQIDNQVFRLLKKTLPGPYTYILEANNKLPKILQTKKKTLGVRIPDSAITLGLVEHLGNPIITTSVKDEDEMMEYTTDPWAIYERYENRIDFVIDGGVGNLTPSTVIDCTKGSIDIIREGLGSLDPFE